MLRIQVLPVGPLQANCLLLWVEGGTEAWVVDPGDEPERILATHRQLGAPPVGRILITHGHMDHIAAVAPLARATGAPVAIHADDAFWLTDPALDEIPGLGRRERHDPEELLQDGQVLELDGVPFTVLHVPGHSPGHVVFHTPGHLIAGDLIFRQGVGRVDLPGCDPEAMVRSLRRIAAQIPPETRIYPGHGPETTLARELADNPFLRNPEAWLL